MVTDYSGRLVPTDEAAKALGLTRRQVQRLCREGKLPCHKAGRLTLVDLHRYLTLDRSPTTEVVNRDKP